MTHIDKSIPKLRRAPQPPLSHLGATADSDRAKQPRSPTVCHWRGTKSRRSRRGFGRLRNTDRGLGTVERTNEEDAIVKWDDDGR